MSGTLLLQRPNWVGVETTPIQSLKKPVKKPVKKPILKKRSVSTSGILFNLPTLLSPQEKEWKKIYPRMQLAQSELLYILGDTLTSTTLKSQGSCFEKLSRKGESYNSLYDIPDLVRGEIIVENTSKVVQVVYWLKSLLSECSISIKKVEAKVSESYHGVVHIDLRIEEVGVEIKVMTKDAKEAHSLTHSWYKQGKTGQGIQSWESVSYFSKKELEILSQV